MTALATVTPPTPKPLARVETMRDYSFEEIREIARNFAESKNFKNGMTPAACFTMIIAGRELGLPPMMAMTQIMMVEGKPTMAAPNVGAMVKRSGKYDYKVRTITNDGCKLEFFEAGESAGFSEFTMDDARTAKLAAKDVWQKYPRNMCFSRAMTNGARWYAAEVFNGAIYTPEELGANVIVTEDGDMRLVGESRAPLDDLTPKLQASIDAAGSARAEKQAAQERREAKAVAATFGNVPSTDDLIALFNAAKFDPFRYKLLGQWMVDNWESIGEAGSQHITERKPKFLSDDEARRTAALLEPIAKAKAAPEPERVDVSELAGLEKFEPETVVTVTEPARYETADALTSDLSGDAPGQQTLLPAEPPAPPAPKAKPSLDPDAPATRSQLTQITLRRQRLLTRTDGPKWEMENYRALMIDAMKVDSATKFTQAMADEFIATLDWQIGEKLEAYPVSLDSAGA